MRTHSLTQASFDTSDQLIEKKYNKKTYDGEAQPIFKLYKFCFYKKTDFELKNLVFKNCIEFPGDKNSIIIH